MSLCPHHPSAITTPLGSSAKLAPRVCVITHRQWQNLAAGINYSINTYNRRNIFFMATVHLCDMSTIISPVNWLFIYLVDMIWPVAPINLLVICSFLIQKVWNKHSLFLKMINVNVLLCCPKVSLVNKGGQYVWEDTVHNKHCYLAHFLFKTWSGEFFFRPHVLFLTTSSGHWKGIRNLNDQRNL